MQFHFDVPTVLGLLSLAGVLYNTYGHGRNGGAIAGIQALLGVVTQQQQQHAEAIQTLATNAPPPSKP